MTKAEKLKIKSFGYKLGMISIGVFAIASVAFAMTGGSGNNIETCNDCIFGGGEAPVEEVFGASGSRFPNGISADSTSPSAGQLRGTTLTTTGAATVGGAFTLTGAFTGSGAVDVPTFTQGGGVTATSTDDTTATLLASEFDTENYIEFTPNVNSITLALPATSTLSSFIPNTGDSRQIIIENATTTASIDVTLAAGTGMDLQEPDGQNVVISTDNYAVLTFWRRSDTDIVVTVDEVIPAD
jgi:hypothetical protein